MRVVLVGSAARRARLRRDAGAAVEIVAEAATLSEARAFGVDVDAYLLAPGVRDEEQLIEELTAREMQVLTLLADGLSNKAIASKLGISDETVKFHLAAVFGKLGASNRTDAVRQALRRGLVPL